MWDREIRSLFLDEQVNMNFSLKHTNKAVEQDLRYLSPELIVQFGLENIIFMLKTKD